MTVIIVLASLLALALVGWVMLSFERYTVGRFQHRFFTKRSLLLGALAAALLWCGHGWWSYARTHAGDQLNGIVLIVLGLAAAAYVVLNNVRRTNVLVGAGGTLMQASVLSAGAAFGAIVFAVVLALSVGFGLLVAASGAKPVFVLNR